MTDHTAHLPIFTARLLSDRSTDAVSVVTNTDATLRPPTPGMSDATHTYGSGLEEACNVIDLFFFPSSFVVSSECMVVMY